MKLMGYKKRVLSLILVFTLVLTTSPAVYYADDLQTNIEQTTTSEPTITPGEPTTNLDEPTTPPEEPTITPGEPTTTPEEPTITPGEPTTTPEEPTITPSEPTTTPEEPTITPGEPTTTPEKPTMTPGESTTSQGEPTTTPDKPTTTPGEPVIQPEVEKPVTVPEEPTMVTSWSFNDPQGTLDGNYLRVLNPESQIDIDTLVSMLPASVHGTVASEDGEAEADITITGWSCDTYIQDENGLWPVSGEYVFTAQTEDGYILVEAPTVVVTTDTELEANTIMPVMAKGLLRLTGEINRLVCVGYQSIGYYYYFHEEPVTGESYDVVYQMEVYTDFPPEETYLPTELIAWDNENKDHFVNTGTVSNPGYTFDGNDEYMSAPVKEMLQSEGMPIAENIQDSYISMKCFSPSGSLRLKRIDGYLDRQFDSIAYMPPMINVGINVNDNTIKVNLPDSSSLENLTDIVNKGVDRVFAAVSDGSGVDRPYQLKLDGYWVPDYDNSEATFPTATEDTINPGIYKYRIGDELRQKWAGRTESNFNWDDISVEVNVGYIIKDFGLNTSIVSYNYNEIKVKNILQFLPQVTKMKFIEGDLLSDKTAVTTKEVPVSWILDPEYYRDPDAIMNSTLKKGDEGLRFTPDYNDSALDGYDMNSGDVMWPVYTFVLSNNKVDEDDNTGSTSIKEIDLYNYKYITNFNIADTFYGFEGQTFEDVGRPYQVLVDYYTSEGETGSEMVDMVWTDEGNDNWHWYSYEDSEENPKGFQFGGSFYSSGQLRPMIEEGEKTLWRYAPSVKPLQVKFVIGKNWVDIDVGYLSDLSMYVEDNILKVYYKVKGNELPMETYDMTEYTGIRLYSSIDDYLLKSTGTSDKLLVVKNSDVNLFLDNVDIKMGVPYDRGYVAPSVYINRPLIDIVSDKKRLLTKDPKFKPHTPAFDPENPYAIEEWNEAESFWYPDIDEKNFDSSLMIHVNGKSSLGTQPQMGPVIRVPYDAMLTINGINESGSELTVTGGAQRTAIGGERDTGYIFIHDIPLNLTRVGANANLSLMGSGSAVNVIDNRTLAKDIQEKFKTGVYPDAFNGKTDDTIKSRPIVISGKNTVVTPVKPKNNNWDNMMTIGTLSLNPDSELIITDGAELRTFSSYLPPAYSIFNANAKGRDNPFKNARIVFNYQKPDEFTVTFDEDGKNVVKSETTLTETARTVENVTIKAETNITGTYPVTALDFLYAGDEYKSFGPIELTEMKKPENYSVYEGEYKMLDTLNAAPLTAEGRIKVSNTAKDNYDTRNFSENIDTDLYRQEEPKICEFYHAANVRIITAIRFATQEEIDKANGIDNNGLPGSVNITNDYGQSAGDAAKKGERNGEADGSKTPPDVDEPLKVGFPKLDKDAGVTITFDDESNTVSVDLGRTNNESNPNAVDNDTSRIADSDNGNGDSNNSSEESSGNNGEEGFGNGTEGGSKNSSDNNQQKDADLGEPTTLYPAAKYEPTISDAGRELMELYSVTAQDLYDLGIDLEAEKINLTPEQRRKLISIGAERLQEELDRQQREKEEQERLAEERRKNFTRVQKAAERAQEIADIYCTTVERLVEAGVDISNPDMALTEEQQKILYDEMAAYYEELEKNYLNNKISYTPGGVTCEFVDTLAPVYGDLVKNYLPQYMYAEVLYSDGNTGNEKIPITWKEEKMPEGDSMELEGEREHGYMTGNSYSDTPKYSNFVKVEGGAYLFSVVLPNGYSYNNEMFQAMANVMVSKSFKTRTEDAKFEQLAEMAREKVGIGTYYIFEDDYQLSLGTLSEIFTLTTLQGELSGETAGRLKSALQDVLDALNESMDGLKSELKSALDDSDVSVEKLNSVVDAFSTMNLSMDTLKKNLNQAIAAMAENGSKPTEDTMEKLKADIIAVTDAMDSLDKSAALTDSEKEPAKPLLSESVTESMSKMRIAFTAALGELKIAMTPMPEELQKNLDELNASMEGLTEEEKLAKLEEKLKGHTDKVMDKANYQGTDFLYVTPIDIVEDKFDKWHDQNDDDKTDPMTDGPGYYYDFQVQEEMSWSFRIGKLGSKKTLFIKTPKWWYYEYKKRDAILDILESGVTSYRYYDHYGYDYSYIYEKFEKDLAAGKYKGKEGYTNLQKYYE